jgi:lysozyme
MPVNGIDVSDFQPDVDWGAVKISGYSFAFSKATQGDSFTAATFAGNWAGLSKAGLLRGAYHMFDFAVDPIKQAQHFLANYRPSSGDLPPALDLELATNESAGAAIASIAKFLGVVEAQVKTKCIMYMGYYFWSGALGSTDGFRGHPLWLAQYSSGEAPTLIPSAWPTWTYWQHTDHKTVGGVAGAVDADLFNGSLDELKQTCLA